MRTIRWSSLASTLALGASLALAQAGPGPGPGPGPRPQGPAVGAPGQGPGPGQHAGRFGGAQWGQDFTPGWSLMTEAERNTHRERLRSMTSVEACQAYMAEHREKMAARAQQQGRKALGAARRDACAGLRR